MVNNRNKPCWCGSSKKFKHCHLGREDQSPVNLYESAGIIKDSKKKLCCVPEGYSQKCEGKIIKAHTVSKSSSLKKISRKGHIYKILPSLIDMHRANGKPTPKLEGINTASTFTGFCSLHDQILFSPIENHQFNWEIEQLFLIAYRAFCYEWYAKKGVSDLEEHFKSLDSGKNIELQMQIQASLKGYFTGINAALKDQKVYKDLFDQMLITKDFTRIKYIGFEFDAPPSTMGAGGFCP